jgi:hypothetical protein
MFVIILAIVILILIILLGFTIYGVSDRLASIEDKLDEVIERKAQHDYD